MVQELQGTLKDSSKATPTIATGVLYVGALSL